QKIQPGAIMPQLFRDDANGRVERYAVARYLASLGKPLKIKPTQAKPKELMDSIERGERLFTAVGCSACHTANVRQAVRGDGSHALPVNGARIRVAAKTVPLPDLGSKTTPEKLAAYLADPLIIDPSGRMPHMNLSGNEARDLARFLCQGTTSAIKQDL